MPRMARRRGLDITLDRSELARAKRYLGLRQRVNLYCEAFGDDGASHGDHRHYGKLLGHRIRLNRDPCGKPDHSTAAHLNHVALHELVHAYQAERETDLVESYTAMESRHGYWDNPYELEAEAGAEALARRFTVVSDVKP